MRSKLKLPNWRFVFLTSVLSVTCVLSLGCTASDPTLEDLVDKSGDTVTIVCTGQEMDNGAGTEVLGPTFDYTDSDTDNVVKAGFGTATAVGFTLLALFMLVGKQHEPAPVLITGHKVIDGRIERSSSGGFSFVVLCESSCGAEEDGSYEIRRKERDDRLYAMYARAFKNEPDEMGRRYLLDCLLNRLPKKVEVIRRAFEDIQRAA